MSKLGITDHFSNVQAIRTWDTQFLKWYDDYKRICSDYQADALPSYSVRRYFDQELTPLEAFNLQTGKLQ